MTEGSDINGMGIQRELRSLRDERLIISEEIQKDKEKMAEHIRKELSLSGDSAKSLYKPKPIRKSAKMRLSEVMRKIRKSLGFNHDNERYIWHG